MQAVTTLAEAGRSQPLPVNFSRWPACMQRRFRENSHRSRERDRRAGRTGHSSPDSG